jgi:hypothetical protein
MTLASSSSHRRAAGVVTCVVGLLSVVAGCRRGGGDLREASLDRDTRPFTPWHRREEPLPFPATEWFWQDLFADAPQPEPLPADAEAAARLKAAFERVATLTALQSEEELPAMVGDARRDPQALFDALDDARAAVRFAAARVEFRLMCAPDRPIPQRLASAAAHHLRDLSDEVALLHLETIARSGFAWMEPVLLKTFGKVDNHRLTVLRIRAAAKLAQQKCYGGIPLLIKALKEQTSLQDDVHREWDASPQTAWWKEEAIDGIAAAAGGEHFGHSPDASDADQVASIRRIERWWSEQGERLWSRSPALDDPELVARVRRMILAFGTFQIRNVDNAGFILVGLGPKVAPLLFEALHGSSFMIRRHLLAVLSQLVELVPTSERARYLAEVRGGLSDPDPQIRVRSLEVIGKSRLPEAETDLREGLDPRDEEMAETALHLLGTWRTAKARAMLEEFERSLPADHSLRIPVRAARLAAGDLRGLAEYLQRLGSEPTPDPRARLYLSWIVESDGLAEAKTSAERRRALERIEAEIRTRAEAR